MPILTCRMGLSLYSRPMTQFLKRSIRLWREWFVYSFFNLTRFTRSLPFFIEQIQIRVVINHLIFSSISVLIPYLCILGVSFTLSEVSRERFLEDNQLHLLEQLPLSLCTYPFFYFRFPNLVFVKRDLAQDCPFLLIPGFLWIWKFSLSKFPYQGSIQLSP